MTTLPDEDEDDYDPYFSEVDAEDARDELDLWIWLNRFEVLG